MKYFINGARIFLGLIFLVFGINGFYLLIPVPDFHPFMLLLASSKYLYVIKALEIIAGVLLLINRYVLAALLILGPIIFNIIFYHWLIDTRNWPVSIVLTFLYLALLIRYWIYFRVFFKSKIPA
ncbi:MAG TPA: hypothetical protein VL947_00640 [Cytophagales bacterium]|nr:hypothetical protein [Cytophagales bacterium]